MSRRKKQHPHTQNPLANSQMTARGKITDSYEAWVTVCIDGTCHTMKLAGEGVERERLGESPPTCHKCGSELTERNG